jgi:hypothetical protein
MAHFSMPKSIPAHSQNMSILSNRDYSARNLFEMITRSSAYAAKFIVVVEV